MILLYSTRRTNFGIKIPRMINAQRLSQSLTWKRWTRTTKKFGGQRLRITAVCSHPLQSAIVLELRHLEVRCQEIQDDTLDPHVQRCYSQLSGADSHS